MHTWPNWLPPFAAPKSLVVVSFKKRTRLPSQARMQSDNVQGGLVKSSLPQGESGQSVHLQTTRAGVPHHSREAASRRPRSMGMDLRHFTASGQPPANPRIHHSKRPALACSLALQSLSSAQKPCQRRDKKRKSARSDFNDLQSLTERTIIYPKDDQKLS